MDSPTRGLRCRYCDEAFKRKEHLDRHVRRHLGSKPFKCTICPKAFSRSKGIDCCYPSDGEVPDRGAPTAGEPDGPETPAVGAGQDALPDRSSLAATARTVPSGAEYGRVSGSAGSIAPLDGLEPIMVANVMPVGGYEAAVPSIAQSLHASPGFEAYSASMNPFDQAWSSLFAPLDQPLIWSFNQELLAHELTSSISSSTLHSSGTPSRSSAQTVARYGDVLGVACSEPPAAKQSSRPSQAGALSFPSLEPDDANVLLSEDFCHVSKINELDYEKLSSFFLEQAQGESQAFPEISVIHTFVQLYYEYFDSLFPCIHPVMLKDEGDSWIALLAVAAVGSQYSSISNAETYSSSLQELLYRAVAIHKPEPHRNPSSQIVQSTLLSLVCLQFSAAGSIGLDLSNKHDAIGRMGSFARQMHMLSLYAEEKFLHYQLSSPLWRTLMAGMAPTQPASSTSTLNNQPNIESILTNAAASVRDAFEKLREMAMSKPESPDNCALLVHYHILSILRQVLLRKLYEFSGWQVTEH
ncbi:hypothetical protein K4K56_004949 [Colletotrichum sp. SAR 10_98]|nr:hypothetical protein K4K56_004949 [Colletotrichum sp. SAR 10_98]